MYAVKIEVVALPIGGGRYLWTQDIPGGKAAVIAPIGYAKVVLDNLEHNWRMEECERMAEDDEAIRGMQGHK